MNQFQVKPLRNGTAYRAIVRRVDRAEAYLLKENGEALEFPTPDEAELAGCRHLLHLLNTEIRFEIAPRAPSDAVALQEKVFGDVVNRKGKKTKVVRKKPKLRTSPHQFA